MTNHIDLMSTRMRVRECTRTRLRQWSRILTAALGLLALHAPISWWPVHLRNQQRAALEAQYEPLRHMKLENTTLELKIAETLDERQLELALSRQTPVVTLVGLVSRAASESDGKVFLERFDYDQKASAENSQTTASVVTLQGISADATAVTQFAERLKAKVDFAKVQVASVEAIEVNKHPLQAFKIEFSF